MYKNCVGFLCFWKGWRSNQSTRQKLQTYIDSMQQFKNKVTWWERDPIPNSSVFGWSVLVITFFEFHHTSENTTSTSTMNIYDLSLFLLEHNFKKRHFNPFPGRSCMRSLQYQTRNSLAMEMVSPKKVLSKGCFNCEVHFLYVTLEM